MRYFAKLVSYEIKNSKNRKRLAANVCETAQRLKSFATSGHVFSANKSQKRALRGVSTNSATAQWKICHPSRTHLDHFSINFQPPANSPIRPPAPKPKNSQQIHLLPQSTNFENANQPHPHATMQKTFSRPQIINPGPQRNP